MNVDLERMLGRAEMDPNSGCWLWTGHCTPKGYGQIGYRGTTTKAHRLSYELHIGPIPKGLLVCHKCDTPACINPAHLFVGTALDNTRDMDSKGRGHRFFRIGGAHPRQRLSDEAVSHIRRREMSAVQYARLYGLSRCYVHQLQSGDFRKMVA